MTFARVKPGGYGFNQEVAFGEMNQLDLDHSEAIDGTGGGTYTPSTAIIIGGEGIDHLYLANAAALEAIDTTSMSTGEFRYVAGFGKYVLDKTTNPTFTADGVLVVQPTTGTGRWYAQDDVAKKQYIINITSSGTWICPPNLSTIEFDIVGGGGGAGGGANTTSSTDDAPGGSGGGAGGRTCGIATVIPLTSYTITVGAAGTAGAANGGNGGAGGVSGIYPGAGVVAQAAGGQAGQGSVANGGAVLIPGGAASQGLATQLAPMQVTGLTQWPINAGDGGFSKNGGSGAVAAHAGGESTSGYAGGTGGTGGTNSSSQKGGSGGGGGGAAFYSQGANGGNGGNGNSSGNGTAGSSGSNGGANTGAGGGGGGGGGAGSTGSQNGGAGGHGGSGQITIFGRS